MITTLLKPRWAVWENCCVQQAYKQKIQQNIMAIALGRTVPAISKKIQHLGLRVRSSIPGRVKGQRQTLPKSEKISLDFLKMRKILKNYAPLEFFKESEFALDKGAWTKIPTFLPNSKKEGKVMAYMELPNASFTLAQPMEYTSTHHPFSFQKGERQYAGEPTYVSLCYVEQWANSQGFHKLRGKLEERGFSYWKNGTYFSKTQLLMHVNRLRYDHNLQPLALLEEDEIELLT